MANPNIVKNEGSEDEGQRESLLTTSLGPTRTRSPVKRLGLRRIRTLDTNRIFHQLLGQRDAYDHQQY